MTAPAPLWPLSPVNPISSVCPTNVGQIFLWKSPNIGSTVAKCWFFFRMRSDFFRFRQFTPGHRDDILWEEKEREVSS